MTIPEMLWLMDDDPEKFNSLKTPPRGLIPFSSAAEANAIRQRLRTMTLRERIREERGA